MRTLRIAHLADTHLGYKYSALPGRDDDFIHSWLSACLDIVESKPDLILHAGDVFHSHRPDWKALTAFNEGMKILQTAGVPIFVIAGNHDNSNIAMNHTVFTFSEKLLPRVVLTNDNFPSIYYLEALDTHVVLVPHRCLLTRDLEKKVEDLLWDLDDDSLKILVSHGDISGRDKSNEIGSAFIPESITQHDWDYMAFGHLHLAQPHGQRGWYSGSTERCGWSDYPASPAWTLVELSQGISGTSVKHFQQPVPYMDMIQLSDRDCTDLTTAGVVEELVWDIDKFKIPDDRCHIRVKLTNLPTSKRKPIEMMLRKAVAKDHPNAVVSIVLDSTITMLDSMDSYTPSGRLETVPEYFRQFVADREYSDEDFADRFLMKGLELIMESEVSKDGES